MNKKFNLVYIISTVISIIFAAWGIFDSKGFGQIADSFFTWVTNSFGWLYLIAMLVFVIFIVGIAFTDYGNIVLGKDGEKPEYSTLSWFGMLFGAGMGIGLVFYGVSEPIAHFVNPPVGIESGTEAAAQFAMRASFMHWGLHPWAGYALIGLGLAYFQFKHDKPGLISTLLIPLFGEDKIKGWLGKLVDIFAVIATIAGIATSLGLGTLQINGGLTEIFNIPNNNFSWLIIILIIGFIYIWTAVAGIEKGINLISNINLILAFSLLGIAFIVGPTLMQLNSFSTGLGQYFGTFFQESLSMNLFSNNDWTFGWRIFYWAWWIAWAPFVGTFIARISRGRTIREFILGVLIVPAVVCIIWFAVFGSMGLNLFEKIGIEGLTTLSANPDTALFKVFAEYPLGTILSVIALMLLCTFFITSANSGTFVLSQFADYGNLNPPKSKIIIFGVLQAVIAYALMISGGLGALQTASIAAAFPFIFIMFAICFSIVKALRQDVAKTKLN